MGQCCCEKREESIVNFYCPHLTLPVKKGMYPMWAVLSNGNIKRGWFSPHRKPEIQFVLRPQISSSSSSLLNTRKSTKNLLLNIFYFLYSLSEFSIPQNHEGHIGYSRSACRRIRRRGGWQLQNGFELLRIQSSQERYKIHLQLSTVYLSSDIGSWHNPFFFSFSQ